MKKNILHWLGLSAAALSLSLAACSGGSSDTAAPASAATDNAPAKKEIRFGATPGDFADMIKEQIKPALEKKGYTVKLTEFSDYVTPNKALAQGDIDINVFQHKPYLDNFKKENNLDLTEAFQVPTAPLGMYAGKLSSLQDVKDGSSVAAPNDPSNFARVLVMLDQLGWVKLKANVNPLTASKADIAENIKHIKLVEMDAANLPRARQDVDFAVVNGNYALTSGMKLTDALFQEPSFAYVNWSAVRTADKDQQWVKDVTDAYNSEEFKAYCYKRFAGYKYPKAWGEQPGAASAPAAASGASAPAAIAP